MQFAPAAFVLPSKIRAIAALAEDYPGTLRLFYGEDSLPTPDFIKEAGCRAITGDHTYYTPNAGTMPLRRAIAEQTARLHGVEVDPAREVVVTASGMVALVLAGPAHLNSRENEGFSGLATQKPNTLNRLAATEAWKKP